MPMLIFNWLRSLWVAMLSYFCGKGLFEIRDGGPCPSHIALTTCVSMNGLLETIKIKHGKRLPRKRR